MTRFTAIDLARLPALPRTAQTFEAIYAAYMADLTARLAKAGIDYTVGSLETDTYAVTGEAFAFRANLVETAIDDAIGAVLLPSSYGSYLDGLGATQDPPVQRNIITPANGSLPAVMEDDDTFRARIQMAPEALSTCGPEGAYLFFALAVPDMLAAAVYGPMSFGGTRTTPFTPLGEVHIPILSGIGDGTASAALVTAVQAAVSPDERRPIADFVTVSAATVIPYTLDILLEAGPGADPEIVLRTAYARLRALADLAHRPGGAVKAKALYAAAYVPDATGAPVVADVDLQNFADVNAVPITPTAQACAYAAPYCAPGAPTLTSTDDRLVLMAGGITVSIEVVDD